MHISDLKHGMARLQVFWNSGTLELANIFQVFIHSVEKEGLVNQVTVMQEDAEKTKEEKQALLARVVEYETMIEEERNQSTSAKLGIEEKIQENFRVLEENVFIS